MLKQPNALLISQSRHCVKTILKEHNEDLTTLEVFVTNYQKIKRFSFRFIWMIVGMACLITCSYQIYDRLSYYLSIPIVTFVTTSNDPVNLPLLRVENIPTDGLKPYWESYKNYTPHLIHCMPPENFFFLINLTNYTEFWMATNATFHIRNIALKINKTIASNVTFVNGYILKSTNSQLIKWNNKFSVYGSAITFGLVNKIKLNSTLIIELTHSGYCKNPKFFVVIEHVHLFYFYLDVTFGQLLKITFSIRKEKQSEATHLRGGS